MSVQRVFVVFCLLLALVGQTYAQQDPTVECLGNLETDARFKTIAGKVLLGDPRKGTFEMLADQSFAIDSEREVIGSWANALTDCARLGDSFRQANYPPQIISLVDEGEFTLLELAVDLYNRKITFGAFNKGRKSLANEVKTKAVEIVQRLQAEHQARMDAQAALDAQERARSEAQWRADIRAEQDRQARESLWRRQAELNLRKQIRENMQQQIRDNQRTMENMLQLNRRPTTTRSTTHCFRDSSMSFTCTSY